MEHIIIIGNREMFDEMIKTHENTSEENLKERILKDHVDAYRSIVIRVKNRIKSESEVIEKLLSEIENGDINGKEFAMNMQVVLDRLESEYKKIDEEFPVKI